MQPIVNDHRMMVTLLEEYIDDITGRTKDSCTFPEITGGCIGIIVKINKKGYEMAECSRMGNIMLIALSLMVLGISPQWAGGQCSDLEVVQPVLQDDFGKGSDPGSSRPDLTDYMHGGSSDGSYVLTPRLNSGSSGWHDAPDHTVEDTSGYALVFRGKAISSDFFQYSVQDLCPQTSYRVIVRATNVVKASSCGQEPFTPLLEVRAEDSESGLIFGSLLAALPLTDELEWRALSLNFTTGTMTTSAKIVMKTITTGSGCGNAWALDDFEVQQISPRRIIKHNLCTDSILVTTDGVSHRNPGTVLDSIPIDGSCAVEHLCYELAHEITYLPEVTIKGCPGDEIVFGNTSYSESTRLFDTLMAGICPVVQPLVIEIPNALHHQQSITLCPRDSVLVGSSWYSSSGTFVDTLVSQKGCDSIVTTKVSQPGVRVTLALNQTVVLDSEINQPSSDGIIRVGLRLESPQQLAVAANVEGIDSFEIGWSGLNISCAHCKQMQWTANETGTLRFKLSSLALSCDIVMEIEMVLAECSPYFVPNAFSPNGDGINDVFTPVPQPCLQEGLELSIYTRWGNLIHRTNGAIEWDGHSRDGSPGHGVYLYAIRAQLRDGQEVTLNGTVLLLN